MPRHVNVQEGSQEDFNTYDFPIVKRPMKSISASAGGVCSVPFYFHNITFLLHITSNAKVSADSAFLKFLPCLLGPAPLTASTLSSHLAQVYCDLKTGGESGRSFSLETLCRILQKAGAENYTGCAFTQK